ncbi:CDP-glycerol glycerophosphotransferase family protein [Jeotgalibacillus haloalkalitolerans]|uniref:CDP-glycerol glycerophosphotransferase family protein n=1 Tax=Jeotgalibacillus haloalkalitolerans TaxID=3104292 RepID=A0ABU5KK40_9BACL|nr:CDP-glycerol glycerophosphotransferase family protein [Jeotgalibacillus sp. HH7-29]MDZ5711296.1 CDP-glycerol glycerophosphotransferase family protein [Jeotgalibacillus sp. HH7-29]
MIYRLFRKVAGKVYGNVIKRLFSVLGKLPKKKNVIIFESFHGKQYSCNPRAIYEYMKDNRPGYVMYWSVDTKGMKVFESRDVNVLKKFSPKWVYMMARAKYWVINTRVPVWMQKPKKTVYLQTWHGTPLKKLGIDIDDVQMPGTTTEKYRKNFLKEAAQWSYLIAPNQYSADIFRKAFGFSGKMLNSGYPRNDILHNENNEAVINQLKDKLGIDREKKVILYAPTWRDDEYFEVGKYKFSLKLDLAKMQEALGDEYVILLRMHYLIAQHLNIADYEGFAYNVSGYADIRDLYLVSDLLITDYSSVFFDYANLKRPMIFFVYDIDKYRDDLRGFYIDFEQEAPGPLVKDNDALLEAIRNADSTDEIDEAFYRKFCAWENGRASERVVAAVFDEQSNSIRK